MLALLQDPIWQFVGAVLALLAIGVTVWIYLAQRPRRHLVVERVARMPLMAVGPKKIPGLKISVNDEPVAEVTVVLVRIRNAGNTPLTASDFESPISLAFGANAKVLYAEVAESNPAGLDVPATFFDNVVQFEKQLLNPGDTYSCRILVQDSIGKYAVSGRVVGVRQIETSKSPRVGPSIAVVAGLLVAIVALILMPKSEAAVAKMTSEEIPYMITAIAGIIGATLFAASELLVRVKRVKEALMLR